MGQFTTNQQRGAKSRQYHIERRRAAVAQVCLLLSHPTPGKISKALSEMKTPFLTSGNRPLSPNTIANDLQVLKTMYRTDAFKDFSEHVSETLAELRQLKAQVWRDKDYRLVLEVMDSASKLLGLNAPDRLQLSGPNGAIELELIPEMDDAMLDKILDEAAKQMEIETECEQLPGGKK